MSEVVFPPSPNWYLPSVVCVTPDGCVIYGSCSNYIAILVPKAESPQKTFSIKVLNVAHKQRVTCLAVCPNWLTTKNFASGADDGIVKLWNADTLSFSIAQNVHSENKETIMGVAFLTENNIVSVGSSGVLVLWDTKANKVKVDSRLLKTFKVICLSACPHKENVVAVGTKQGVVLVLEFRGRWSENNIKILFKVHGHETEVTSICWCPAPRCEPLEKLLAMKRPKNKSMKFRKVMNKKSDTVPKNEQADGPIDDKSILNTSECGLYEQSSGEEADESDIFEVYKESGYNLHSDSEKDNDNTKYTPSMLLRKNIQSINEKIDKNCQDFDTNLTSAMEAVNLKEEPTKSHNEEFLIACQKMQNIMNSKKIIKSQSDTGVLVDESVPIPDDSLLQTADDTHNASQIDPADQSDIFDVYKDASFYEFGHSKYVPEESKEPEVSQEKNTKIPSPKPPIDFLEECKQFQEFVRSKKQIASLKSQDVKDEDAHKKESDKDSDKMLNRSTDDANTDDDLLDSSLRNESTVNVADESEIFDIYKEPSFHEFGHSKYVPSQSDNEAENEKPRVKLSSDFLKECAKLKELVAGKSDENSSENEISDLSSNVKKLALDAAKDAERKPGQSSECNDANKFGEPNIYLATCCKRGKVSVWRWGGGLVCSGSVMLPDKGKDEKMKKLGHPWGALCWPLSSLLLTSSKAAQLLRCNFHTCYQRSKMFGFSILHEEHSRGLYSISAARDWAEEENWRTTGPSPLVWTSAQDRQMVAFCPQTSKVVANLHTFGGYVNDIAVSPIDPCRFAIAVGDGMVRVWERGEGSAGSTRVYWNGVQGKVQAVAWHPTREYCLAFCNSEGRVGLLDASSMGSAKVLPPGLALGAHGMCWGPRNVLFVNGGGELVVYNTAHINRDPEKLLVSSKGKKWGVSTAVWTDDYLTVGSAEGQLGLLKPDYPYEMITFATPHRKSIMCVAWHPIAVSSEDGMSPYADLVAISSGPIITIMKTVKDEDGEVKLELFEEFNHHNLRVNALCWSPHHNGKLMSVSHDSAVQIVDILSKTLLHTLLGHNDAVLTCLWCPVAPGAVLTAGEDHTLRLWTIQDHPPQEYSTKKSKQRKKMKLALVEGDNVKNKQVGSGDAETPSVVEEPEFAESDCQLARNPKSNRKYHNRQQSTLTLLWKQVRETSKSMEGCRRMFQYLVAKKTDSEAKIDTSNGYDYLKVYGSYNDVTELIDFEQEKHEETRNWNAWIMLGILRGDCKRVLETAGERRWLCPMLLSIAPSVSHRFWKEMAAVYAAQLDCVENENNMIYPPSTWRAAVLLCSGTLEDACYFLCSAGMAPDAVAIASLRHAEHIAHSCLRQWAQDNINQNRLALAAECYLALNEVMTAATTLGKSNDEEHLALSAEMAKYASTQDISTQ